MAGDMIEFMKNHEEFFVGLHDYAVGSPEKIASFIERGFPGKKKCRKCGRYVCICQELD